MIRSCQSIFPIIYIVFIVFFSLVSSPNAVSPNALSSGSHRRQLYFLTFQQGNSSFENYMEMGAFQIKEMWTLFALCHHQILSHGYDATWDNHDAAVST